MNETISNPISPSASAKGPEPTQYLDYRKFLADWYDHQKVTQASFTGASFAKKAKIKSHSLLGMVIRGERNLSYKTIPAFISGLSLKKEQARYFENLVLYNQAQTHEEKIKYLGLFKIAQTKTYSEIVDLKDKNQYFSHWHVVAVRELTSLPSFQPSGEWIAKKLKNKITKAQAESALDLLQRLKLIEKDSTGQLIRKEGSIVHLPEQSTLPLREFYKSFHQRMINSYETGTPEEREVGSVTLAVTEEELLVIKAKLRETMDALIETFNKDSQEKRDVIMVQMQALQLTNRNP